MTLGEIAKRFRGEYWRIVRGPFVYYRDMDTPGKPEPGKGMVADDLCDALQPAASAGDSDRIRKAGGESDRAVVR
jgi:hypothetical protein